MMPESREWQAEWQSGRFDAAAVCEAADDLGGPWVGVGDER